jgi:hypothetical protein
MLTTLKGYPGLYREESITGRTWFRINITSQGKKVQHYFPYKGKAAEQAAKKKALEKWHEIRAVMPVIAGASFRNLLRKKGKSGIVGITRLTRRVKGRYYDFWQATWTDKHGLRKTKIFSINKYGEEQAKQNAIEARRTGMKGLK